MKVTFLVPPVLDNTRDVDRCFGCNYGLYFLPLLPVLYSATLLKGEVERIDIEDFSAKKKTKQDFQTFIETRDSDIFIFYSVFLSQKTDLIARDMIRAVHPEARFIYTGPQATNFTEAFLDKEDTFVVRGEPEFVTHDLIKALKSDYDISTISGVSYFRNSTPLHNQPREMLKNLDHIPIPDRTLLDHSPYYNPKLRKTPHTALITSRGCFGQCWYCVPGSLAYTNELEYKKVHGRKPPARLHSVQRVIEEFRQIAGLGFKSVSVIDDEFLWSEERTLAICEGIKELGLEWFCLGRPDKVTEKSARAMREAGCVCIDMGTESFVQTILDDIRKGMTPEDTKRAVKILKDAGIEPEINVLIGATPKETEETIKETLREVEKLDVDYVLYSIANPFPGTDFYNAAKQNGWLVYGEYRPVDPAKDSIISYPHLTKKRLEELIAYAYRRHYFNPRYLVKNILRLKSLRDFWNKSNTALGLIKRNFLQK